MLYLEVLNSAAKGKQFRMKAGLTIGSGAECQIRAQAENLQEVHCRFYDDGPRHMVEIATSKARLFVNGREVMRSELRHNDQIVVGPLRLKVVDDAQVSNSAIDLDKLLANYEANVGSELHDFAREDLFYLATKDPAIRQNVSFVIPSKDKFMEQAQVFLARLVKQSGMEEEKVDFFMTCAKELILNAHRHGHKYDESKKIIIRYRDRGDRLAVTIEDEGAGFDHRSKIDNIRNKSAAELARIRIAEGGFGGLGFTMIVKMADELQYNEAGNVVSFSVKKKADE
jgi:anti-sigma regulatory factor (Ser/Thr protein kinase)